MNRYVAWLLGIALGAAGATGWHQVNRGADDEFNDEQPLWLRRVDGSNTPIDGPINSDATNIWTACLDGDLYDVTLGPFIAEDRFVALSVADDYRHWCADDESTNWDPFKEDQS